MRELMEKYKGATIAAVGAVVLLVVVFAFREMSPQTTASAAGARDFYTIDDGATYFEDSADRLPPFTHKGKVACRAVVFTCDGGKTTFVGYLERYTPAAQKRIEAARAGAGTGSVSALPSAAASDTEVKKPGANERWVPRIGAAGMRVMQVSRSSGGAPEPVIPGA